MSTQLLSEVNAGRTISVAGVTVQNKLLDGLVQRARVTVDSGAGPVSLTGKRVALVLSSNTIQELDRYKRERQALIDASSGLTGNAAKLRDDFIFSSSPNRLLATVFGALQQRAGRVTSEDDLTALQQGRYDYAFILDWKDESKLGLLGKYDSFPTSVWGDRSRTVHVACALVTGFLVNPELKAVMVMPSYSTEGCTAKYADDKLQGDEGYFYKLVGHYRYFLGDGGDMRGDLFAKLRAFFRSP